MIFQRKRYKSLDVTITDTAAQLQNCEFVWESGAVDKSTGKRTDTYKMLTKPSGGGTACEHEDGYTKTVDVPIACEGNWNSWGNCSKSCDSGTRSRTWNTTVEPKIMVQRVRRLSHKVVTHIVVKRVNKMIMKKVGRLIMG